MALQLISFLFFTGLVAFFSWRATRADDHETSAGYFLAGRRLSWIVIAGSLLLTNLSTEQLVGLNGGAYEHGMQVMAWEVWAAVAMVVMALVFLPRYLKGGVTTVSQFLGTRYDRTTRTIISILLLLSLLTNLLPFVLFSGAIFMREVFGIAQLFGGSESAALWATVAALGVVGGIYAIFGGLKAVAISDTLNGIGLFIGGLAIPILGLYHLGGGDFGQGIEKISTVYPEKLNSVGGPADNIPFHTLFTGMILINVYYWCTNQAIVQRTFGARSLEQGQKGLLFAAFMKLLGPFYLVLPGIIAFHMFATMTTGDGRDVVVVKPVAVQSATPGGESDGVQNPTTAESARFVVVDAEGNESEIPASEVPPGVLPLSQKDASYARLVGAVLPPWMLGFFAAVIFGAILSSFNSGLNSATTLFSFDLYKGLINPDATDHQTVRVGKIFGTIIGIGAILVAPLIELIGGGLFDAMKKLAALYNIPLLAIVVVGIFSKRAPAVAAIVALVTGFAFYAVFGLALDNTILGHKFHWLDVAGINFAVIVGLMLLITAIRPRETPFQQEYTREVDIQPWKLAMPVGVTVLALVGGIYWFFSRFG